MPKETPTNDSRGSEPTASPIATLFVIYNASGSLLGHLAYGYHHIRQTPGKECSACALTHGPRLAVTERAEWSRTRWRLESGELIGDEGKGVAVRTLHKEEVDEGIKTYLRKHDLSLPCALLEIGGGRMETVFTKEDLDVFEGDLGQFEQALGTRLAPLL
ncbi:hypothetical protein JCM24511_02123 [Saitozyma sp. JCM 24511]|nr:hypothetical protein JCM24511_02123 [Saitozyma sp. JCM 24511]